MRRITSKRGDEARKLMAEEDAGLRPKARVVIGGRERRAIDGIVIGERHRKDLGDLDALAASIGKLGLLQAIGVTKSNELVFGERRLRACADRRSREISRVQEPEDGPIMPAPWCAPAFS